MHIRSALLTWTFIAALAIITHGQMRTPAQVVEIMDGKTVVLALPNGRVTVELSNIDVPEVGQPLCDMVREHLKTLVAGKRVDFRLVGFAGSKSVGRLYLNDIDIGRQMLRDGAAWLVPQNVSGQPADEFALYSESEALAKQEIRGLWAIKDLKPAWEVRVEREEQRRTAQVAEWDAVAKQMSASGNLTPGRPREGQNRNAGSDLAAWANVYARVGKESVGVSSHVDPTSGIKFLSTSGSFVDLKGIDGAKKRLETRSFFAKRTLPDGRLDTIYLIGFQSISENFDFSKHKSSLSITADNQRFSMPIYHGLKGEMAYGVHEIFYYKLTRAAVTKIAGAKVVTIKIDQIAGTLSPEAQYLIKQLVDSAF